MATGRASDWLGSSIMAARGVAKGAVGATHELTEEKQGSYHYTMGPIPSPCSKSSRATG